MLKAQTQGVGEDNPKKHPLKPNMMHNIEEKTANLVVGTRGKGIAIDVQIKEINVIFFDPSCLGSSCCLSISQGTSLSKSISDYRKGQIVTRIK
jgi:hypothetical protein